VKEHDDAYKEQLAASLASLQPVRVQPVTPPSAAARLCRCLLPRYHYLGLRNCVGENLQYLARDRTGRPLACLLFGSPAWKAAARDQWLGWTEEQRRRHLGELTNNTRFLILPWVRVRHLASHLLALVTARLSDDWQQKYGHPIYLVETFVEQPRFAGTGHRAAGWRPVGRTTGRTRNDDGRRPRTSPRAIYLKVLRADALQRWTA
jgi:hypothetical protein